MFDGKTILVTGGTGSFGRRFVATILERYRPRRLVVFSRDELKQYDMSRTFSPRDHKCLRYFSGDVRDVDRLRRAFAGIEYVVHAAAMKQVPTAEYNPSEAVKTNVIGAQNVIDAAIASDVHKVVALSSDKAANPINLYGATKLCSDKLFIAANSYAGRANTRFVVVRYGNVVGSRGSVVPLFKDMAAKGEIPITDRRMTRFWLTLDQGIEVVLKAFAELHAGEIYVPKLPSMRIVDLAECIAPGVPIKDVGIRPGEKLHEVLIPADEALWCREFDDHFRVLPQFPSWHADEAGSHHGQPVADRFLYASDTNETWLSVDEMRSILETEAAKG